WKKRHFQESKAMWNSLAVDKHVHNLHRGYKRWPSLNYGLMPALGDARWTADLILATWLQATTGRPPENGLEYRVGKSGGGFDCLDFRYLPPDQWHSREPDLTLSLNRRANGQKIDIPLPFYGSGMSYGSVSEHIMLARAKAAQKWNTFTSTGEGGYPESL